MLPNLRYERKFLTEGSFVPELLALVKRHPAAFRQPYPARIVNNLYLDSADRRSYHDHINGTSNRTKTRVRWYGPPGEQIERPVLERKFKNGVVSGKTGDPLASFSLNGEGFRATLQSVFAASTLSDLLRLELHHLEPSLFNRYHRHYFVSADGYFRLTVDSKLQFGPPQTQSVTARLPELPLVVLEFKFDGKDVDAASWVANSFPFRMVRCSKYVIGIERLGRTHGLPVG